MRIQTLPIHGPSIVTDGTIVGVESFLGGDPGPSRGGDGPFPVLTDAVRPPADAGDGGADRGDTGAGRGVGALTGGGASDEAGRTGAAPALPAVGHTAADSLDTAADSLDTAADSLNGDGLRSLSGGGLAVPRFGPDSALSVMLPPAAPIAVTPRALNVKGAGKEKPPRRFRVPGDRGRAPSEEYVTTEAEFQSRRQVPGGTMTLVTYRGRTVAAEGDRPPDGLAEMAAELLNQGVLQESDWCGSLSRSVRRGLDRWAHEEMGAGRMRVLTGLELVYTDDAPSYSDGARLGRWVDYFRARHDRPVGFFAFRWKVSPKRVHVREAVEALEAAWPGYGFSLIELLERTFVTGVQGHSFFWGKQALASNAFLMRQWQRHDQSPFEMTDDPYDLAGLLRKPQGLSEDDFFRLIPRESVKSMWRLDAAQRAEAEAPGLHPELAPLTAAAMEVWDSCRASGVRFQTLNHAQWLSWRMTNQDLKTGKLSGIDIPGLQRAPTCYTVWDDKDLMGRLVDDYHEFCRSNWAYTDLTWMHCFQAGHAGVEPELGAAHVRRQERLVKKVAKTNPELVSMWDPGYKPDPMPDGSVAHAVTALRYALRIVVALDRLLWLMESRHLEAERVEAGRVEAGRVEAEHAEAKHVG